MIFAIGVPGQPVRMFIDTPSRARANAQLRAGEVLVEAEAVVPGRAIAAAGTSLVVTSIGTEDPLHMVRIVRNRILAETDRTQLLDSGLTAEQRQQVAVYRQALRDLPEVQPNADLGSVVWPDEPDMLMEAI